MPEARPPLRVKGLRLRFLDNLNNSPLPPSHRPLGSSKRKLSDSDVPLHETTNPLRRSKRPRPITPPESLPPHMSLSLPEPSFDGAASSAASSVASSIGLSGSSREDNDQTLTKRRRVVPPPFGASSPSRRRGSASPHKQIRNAALGTVRTISYDARMVPLALCDLWRSISDYDGGIGTVSYSGPPSETQSK